MCSRQQNVESLPSASIKSWCDTCFEAKSIETEETTHARYKRVIERFTGFLGDAKSKERARATANLGVKVLRVCLGEAVRQGYRWHRRSLRLEGLLSLIIDRHVRPNV
jgi:hypothetical protein